MALEEIPPARGNAETLRALVLDDLQIAAPLLEALASAGSLGEKIALMRKLLALGLRIGDEEVGRKCVRLDELVHAIAALGKVTGIEALKKRLAAGSA